MPSGHRDSIPLARCVALAPFIGFLERGGASTQTHLRDTRIDPDLFLSPESLLPFRQAAWFIDRSGRREGVEDFGLQVGATTPVLSLGLFGIVLAQALTVRDLVLRLVQWAPSLNSGVRIELVDRGEPTVEIRIWHTLDESPRHIDDFALVLVIDALRLGLGPDWRPKMVALSPQSARFASRLESLSEAKCLANPRRTAVYLHRSALDLPLRERLRGRAGNPELDFARTSPSADFGENVEKVVESMLGIEPPTIEATAEIAATSVRSLQRRLAGQATTFEDIVDRVRFEKALGLLADPMSKLGSIAERLGYSDAANFSRAFRRWTGSAPGAYRAKHSRLQEASL